MIKQKIVTQFIYDWHQVSDENSSGEDYGIMKIENQNVESIIYHEPRGEGDKHYCTVTYKDGSKQRFFNLNSVKWDEV